LFRKRIISLGCGGGGNRTALDVATLGVTEVATWLETLQLSEYEESFTRHYMRGRELLILGRRDTKELCVTKVEHNEEDTAGCQGPHHVILMEADYSGGQSSP
jgi:hypothetical protein